MSGYDKYMVQLNLPEFLLQPLIDMMPHSILESKISRWKVKFEMYF